MEKIRDWLSDQFWAGMRWVTFDIRERPSGRLKCYVDYADAAQDCLQTGGQEWIRRMRVLASVLRAGRGSALASIGHKERSEVNAVVSRYPVRLPHSFAAGWEEELYKGNYYPLVWVKYVEPLLEIEAYVVLWQQESVNGPVRELIRGAEFPQAMVALDRETRRLRRETGSLWLLGEFGDIPVGHGNRNAGDQAAITLYRVHCGKGGSPEITTVHDPMDPVVQRFPMFARYHRDRAELSFYDGRLQRIRTGDRVGCIDLGLFDFSTGTL